jgi:thioesterase domain-containing protein
MALTRSTPDVSAPDGVRLSQPGHRSSRFVVMHPRGQNKGIFWITPDAPQSAAFRELGRELQIVCLRAPAHPRDRPPLALQDLAAYYAESVGECSRNDPVTLVGYCIAAVLARETAIALSARGRRVRSLIMVDPPDPAKSRALLTRDPFGYRLFQQARRWSFHLSRMVSPELPSRTSYLQGSIAGVLARRDYGKSKSAYAAARTREAALPDRFSDGYHVAVAAFMNSTPGPYSGSACVIRPTDVPRRSFEYSNLRWLQLITGSIEFVDVPGNSDTMWQEPAVKVLCDVLRARLA